MELCPKHRRCPFGKDEGGFKVSLPQVWSFALSVGVVFLGKTKVDLKYPAPKRGASVRISAM